MILPLRAAIACCLAFLLLPIQGSSARADDSSPGVMLPGLQAEPQGSVSATAASVDLHGNQIVLGITLRRSAAGGAAVVIRGPRFSWRGEAEPYPERQFPELNATLDGAEAPAGRDFAAFAGESDITDSIHEADLDPFAITESPPFVDPPPDAGRAAFDRLLAAHAVRSKDGQFFAQWSAQRLFHFDIGNRPQTVLSLRYRARPGFSLVTFSGLPHAVRLGLYCVSPPALSDRLGPGAADRRFVVKTYDIAVGIDGTPPPGVAVRAESRRAVFCKADGTAAFGGPDTAFRPARVDIGGILRVLELNPPG